MKKIYRIPLQILSLCWGLLLVSCTSSDIDFQDRRRLKTKLDTIVFHLDASASFPSKEMRSLPILHEIWTLSPGEQAVVSTLQLKDGDKVMVITMVASNDGYFGVAELLWTYEKHTGGNRDLDRLVLRDQANSSGGPIILTKDSRSSGQEISTSTTRKWYLSAFIGGKLQKTGIDANYRIVVDPSRSVSPRLGVIEQANYPYSMAWTPIGTTSSSRRLVRGESLASDPLVFEPEGAIVYYTFEPLGESSSSLTALAGYMSFSVVTNMYTDQGYFEITRFSEATHAHQRFGWVPDSNHGIFEMHYSLPLGSMSRPETNRNIPTWVMPAKRRQYTSVDGQTHMEDYRIQAFVDGISKAQVEGGINSGLIRVPSFSVFNARVFQNIPTNPKAWIEEGRTYSIRLTEKDMPLMHPLEYVEEYNLAGGEGLNGSKKLMYPYTRGEIDMPGYEGSVRWSRDGAKPELSLVSYRYSGSYNWYIATGTYHATYNPSRYNLFGEKIGGVTLGDTHYLPAQEDWASVLPGIGPYAHTGLNPNTDKFYWNRFNENTPRSESYRLAGGTDAPIYMTTRAIYSDPISVGDGTNDVYVYALRHLKPTEDMAEVERSWRRDGSVTQKYPLFPSNRFASIYRYRRVKDHLVREREASIEIEAILIGEEGVKALGDIQPNSIGSKWDEYKNRYKYVGKRVLPSGSKVAPNPTNPFQRPSTYVADAGGQNVAYGSYWSSTPQDEENAFFALWENHQLSIDAGQLKRYGMLIRPFLRYKKHEQYSRR